MCNSNHKRAQFPRDEQGAPLLIDPTVENPRWHLDFDPMTGKYVGRTRKGEESVRVYGLGRGPLVRMRRAAWASIQAHLIIYAQDRARGDVTRAEDLRRTLCAHPHATVLLYLLDVVDTPAGPELIRDECLAAIDAHPEIRGWLAVAEAAS